MTSKPAGTMPRLAGPAAVCLVVAVLLGGCDGASPVAPTPPPGGNPHEWVEATRSLSGVLAVILDVGVVCDLRIEQGDHESIWIRADETVLPFLDTTVRDGVLELRYPFEVNPAVRPPKPLELELTVVDLEGVELRDGGTISSFGLSVDRLALRSSGGGEIELDGLLATVLEVEVLAAGQIRVAGEVDRQRVTLAGLGAYDGRGLASREADVEVAHRGSATVRVSQRLRATISGSGSVYYFGDPEVESLITGSGQVVRLGA